MSDAPAKEGTLVARLLLVEIWRWTQLGVGWLLMILGPLVGGPLPGPFGVIGFAAGLILVLRNSRWARRYFIRLKRRHPSMLGPVRHALKHGVNLSAVLQRVWAAIRAKLGRRGASPPHGGRRAGAETAPEAAARPDGRDG